LGKILIDFEIQGKFLDKREKHCLFQKENPKDTKRHQQVFLNAPDPRNVGGVLFGDCQIDIVQISNTVRPEMPQTQQCIIVEL
jgi:hypothetical protein